MLLFFFFFWTLFLEAFVNISFSFASVKLGQKPIVLQLGTCFSFADCSNTEKMLWRLSVLSSTRVARKSHIELKHFQNSSAEWRSSLLGKLLKECFFNTNFTNWGQVLLLDEPTSALDPVSTRHIEESVMHLCRSTGLTVIMVSHSIEQVKRMADLVCLVVAGELIEVLKPTELVCARNPRAQEYLRAAQQQ